MASPSFTHVDHLQASDVYDCIDWAISRINCSPHVPLAYQSSTSILAEPSLVSENPHLYTDPNESVTSSFPASSTLSSCSDRCRFTHNVMHQSRSNDGCATMAPAGHAGPRHVIAGATSPASTSSGQLTSKVRATSDSSTKGKGYSGRNRGRQQKQEKPQRSFECHWKDCTYPNPFSGKPALMRHIDTQHVNPRSFDCPACAMSFNRKDNLIEHRGRVHWERVGR